MADADGPAKVEFSPRMGGSHTSLFHKENSMTTKNMNNYEIYLKYDSPERTAIVYVSAEESGIAMDQARRWVQENHPDVEKSRFVGSTAMEIPYLGGNKVE
jgi:hypothetical protein